MITAVRSLRIVHGGSTELLDGDLVPVLSDNSADLNLASDEKHFQLCYHIGDDVVRGSSRLHDSACGPVEAVDLIG